MTRLSDILLCFLLCCPFFYSAQEQADTTQKKPRRLLAGVPLLFYTPETRWGFGATGTCIFNWKNDSIDARSSSVSVAGAFTQNKQVFFTLPYHLFLKNSSWQLYGELAYNRYHYNFYGRGNNVSRDFEERYGVEFPRIRITALKKFRKYFYAGPRYAFDSFSLYDLIPGGLFSSGTIPGSEGGRVSGFGAVFVYDSRDNIFYPSKGILSELVVFRNHLITGGSSNFTRLAFDLSKYVMWKKKNILAVNLYSIFSPDELPFYQMGLLGGIKKMRGFYEGRFRDNNVILFQAEYRRWIWGPIGLTAFASAGQVASRYNLFHHTFWRYTWGAGLRVRVDKTRKVNLRIDAAVGYGKILPYFTIAEAF